MKKLLFSLLPLALIASGGAAYSAGDGAAMSGKEAANPPEMPENWVAGDPEKCVSTSRLGQPVAYSSETIIYSGRGRTSYVNNLPVHCPGLDDDSIIVAGILGPKICSGDTIEPVNRFTGSVGPVCRLGDFIPYKKKRN